MTTETMGLPTNHDYHRQQPFEHKLDIKECTQPSHTTLFILCCLLHHIIYMSFFFFLLSLVSLLIFWTGTAKMLNFSSLNSLDILNYVSRICIHKLMHYAIGLVWIVLISDKIMLMKA